VFWTFNDSANDATVREMSTFVGTNSIGDKVIIPEPINSEDFCANDHFYQLAILKIVALRD
jgi:hypothetical protein